MQAMGSPISVDVGCVSRLSKVLLRVSAVIYGVGFFVAYTLGPILTKLDSG
jgi:hypothetical protein